MIRCFSYRHGFTGAGSLKRKATVFRKCRRMSPHSGVVMLYDGPEHRGEGELSGKHPYNRLMRRVAVALAGYEGETRRGVKLQGAVRGIRVHGSERGADISGFSYVTGRRRRGAVG